MSIDDNIKKINEINKKLENPDLSIDEGIKLYENGVSLAKNVLEELNSIKGKVTIIKKELETYKEEVFE